VNIPYDAVLIATQTFYGTAIDGSTSDEDLRYATDLMRQALEAAAPLMFPAHCPRCGRRLAA
jgi:hypothetical protein